MPGCRRNSCGDRMTGGSTSAGSITTSKRMCSEPCHKGRKAASVARTMIAVPIVVRCGPVGGCSVGLAKTALVSRQLCMRPSTFSSFSSCLMQNAYRSILPENTFASCRSRARTYILKSFIAKPAQVLIRKHVDCRCNLLRAAIVISELYARVHG